MEHLHVHSNNYIRYQQIIKSHSASFCVEGLGQNQKERIKSGEEEKRENGRTVGVSHQTFVLRESIHFVFGLKRRLQAKKEKVKQRKQERLEKKLTGFEEFSGELPGV
jgi:hypothetical protein